MKGFNEQIKFYIAATEDTLKNISERNLIKIGLMTMKNEEEIIAAFDTTTITREDIDAICPKENTSNVENIEKTSDSISSEEITQYFTALFPSNVIILLTHNVKGLCYFLGQPVRFHFSHASKNMNIKFAILKDMGHIQRRQDVKIKVDHLEITLTLPFRDKQVTTAQLLDISAGGMLIVCPQFMLMENELLLYHFTSANKCFYVNTRILRIQDSEKDGRCYGCRFEDLTQDEEALIRYFVFELERIEMMKKRGISLD